ncbi:MAG: hypothetical protein D6812_12720 [Deltaproteobacteria bacterium]|nr:MAG: hypothetical protein D6812_12720 [Deltaproteobacteria bacterium]
MILILDERNVLPQMLLLGLRRYGLEGIHEGRIDRAKARLSQTDLCLAGELSSASWEELHASLQADARHIPLLLLSELAVHEDPPPETEWIGPPTDLDAFGRKIVEIAGKLAPALLERPGAGKRLPVIQTTGTIEENVPEIFGACHLLRLSGSLHLSQNGAIKTVFFQEGVPVLAHSSDEAERIGSLLIREEKISERQLHDALKSQQKSRKRIGAIFVDQGYLNETERKLALQLQTELICLSLFSWAEGDFLLSLEDRSFDGGELWGGEAPERTILRGIQMHYTLTRLAGRLPPPTTRLRLTPRFFNGAFPVQIVPQPLLTLLTRGTPTIEEICRTSRMGELESRQILYTLFVTGAVAAKWD